ncbi:hypothetical protein Patl1_01501 [Pistacia atlantica]|uniref:Uncharacterized protein n=1 Tax=Pistacia atlantica TaxID=434234 RepID=A0ACC1C9H5_9ROSI|nr:hypothetical protein Patl1_01501 [Pistacia atlantica]
MESARTGEGERQILKNKVELELPALHARTWFSYPMQQTLLYTSSSQLHYPAAESANMVTNFMGTSFLLTIFGGFISDSFFTRSTTFILFCIIELLGLVLLHFKLKYSSLQPPINTRPSRSQATLLYTGLYTMATGVGGLIAATVMVWVEENKGWNWSFKISIIALSLALCLFAMGFPIYRHKRPIGSALTRVFKVLASAVRQRKASVVEMGNHNAISAAKRTPDKLRFLDKALCDDTITAAEVDETKTFLGLFPIFASTIMMNCCLAQLQTFSVQQGNIMNRTLNNFKIPTQSLSVFPLTIMLVSIPLYERFVHSFGSKVSPKYNIFLPLKRIGLGLALASGSMAVAAVVEAKRRSATTQNDAALSVFWLVWQYLLLGISDMLTLGGMLEFFYSEAPDSMRSICTALSWCSTSMGFFISSVLVSFTNLVSGQFGQEWLGGNDLNRTRLDLFYALLSILNLLNFINYVYWANRY